MNPRRSSRLFAPLLIGCGAFGAFGAFACGPMQGEPPKVVTVPVGSASSMPIATMSAPPPAAHGETDLVTNLMRLPNGEEAIGAAAPGFSLKSVPNAGPVPELRFGRVTIVHFWATWCAPCTKSLPALDALHERLKTRGAIVIGISVDDEPLGVPEFVTRLHVRFAVGWDPGHKIAELYQPNTMPCTYVIDRSGIVRFVHQGYHDGETATIDEEIQELL